MSTPDTPPEDRDPLVKQVRRYSERQRLWRRDGEKSVARHLAQIGVLGWIIVVPMLLGAGLGRWLDGVRDTGVFWTAPLLILGLALGCWSAWKWVQSA
jgi:ATP synthase protein I